MVARPRARDRRGSNIFASGVWELRVAPRDGGSHIEVLNHRKVKGKGRAIAPILMVVGGPILKKQFQKTLDVLRAEAPAREKTTV